MKPQLMILDRDGTIIEVPRGQRYLHSDDAIQFVPGAPEFIAALNRVGIPVVVATNQQGVALEEYPAMTLESVDRFHERLQVELLRRGAQIDRFYICTHLASAGCDCRKPRPGMYVQAMRDFSVAPKWTVAIGDQSRDAVAAIAAGIPSVWTIQTVSGAPQPIRGKVNVTPSLGECLRALLG